MHHTQAPATVLALAGTTGDGSPAAAAAWAATLAQVATWPGDQLVRPVIERRFSRAGRRGALRETVLVALHNPLGVLSAAEAGREVREIARPLMAACALQTLGPAARERLLRSAPARLIELGTLSQVMPEGARAMAPLSAALLDGLAELPGRVSYSLVVGPGSDHATGEEDDELLRTVDFRLRLGSDAVLPIALRAAGEALCVAGRALTTPWREPRTDEECDRLRGDVESVCLHTWDGAPDDRTGARPAVAVAMLAMAGPERDVVLSRAFTGKLATEGPAIGRATLATGRQGTWRMPWATRCHHTLVVGGTGSGKSSTLVRMADADIAAGRTVVLIDPHGDLADRIAARVPAERLVHIDPRLAETAPLDLLDPDPARAAAHLSTAVAEVWPREFSGPVFQGMVSLALRALHASRRINAVDSLADLERFYVDPAYRDVRIGRIPPGPLRDEAERAARAWSRPGQDQTPVTSWAASKLTPLVRGPGAALFQQGSPWSLEERVTQPGAVIVIALPLGVLGGETLRLTGRMLMSRLVAAISSQGNVPEAERVPISVLIDEAHGVVGDALEGLFAQARKFNTAVTVATQSPSQLGAHLSSVLTNTESMLLGRLPASESRHLIDRVGATTAEALVRLPKFHTIPIDERHDPVLRPVVLRPLARPSDVPGAGAGQARAAVGAAAISLP